MAARRFSEDLADMLGEPFTAARVRKVYPVARKRAREVWDRRGRRYSVERLLSLAYLLGVSDAATCGVDEEEPEP